jgi:hypothetical protein
LFFLPKRRVDAGSVPVGRTDFLPVINTHKKSERTKATMKLSSVITITLACLLAVGSVGTAYCQTWTPMSTAPPVSFGWMQLLTDGRVLLHEEPNCSGSTCKGKDYTAWYTLTPDINGNYATGTFTQVASSVGGYAPLYFSSAVLPDGKVITQGGEYQCAAGSCASVWQSLGQLYDPVQNTWVATVPPIPNSLEAFGDAQSQVLPNGTFMDAACCAMFVGYTPFPAYFYFNENTLSYTEEGYTGDGGISEFDESGWNLMPNGQIMMVDVPLGAGSTTFMSSSIYDPPSNTWLPPQSTQVQLWDDGCGDFATASYELGPVMLMPNGTLFATGASNCHAGNIATYDLTAQVWTAQSPFPGKSAANDAPGATEINGNAIVITSPYTNTFSTPLTIYEWNGTTLNSFPNVTNASKDDSYVTHLLQLPNGQIMFTDFSTNGIELLTSAGTYEAAWQPTITSAPTNLTIGQTYQISGTQFNGVTTGAAYGDDFQDNTNYPLVRIVNNGTGHVFYARTHGHSTMAVATGSTPVSTNFDVLNMETGPCQLYVVANGIPSAPSACTVGQPVGIYSPANNTPLTSTSVTFTWGGSGSATAYWLDVGAEEGGNEYEQSGSLPTSTLSMTVSTLPSNGSAVWARLYYLVSGTWQYVDNSYTALGGPASLGSINTPTPGSTLASTSQAFTWSQGTGATAYELTAGSTMYGTQYYSSGNIGNVVTATATSLPTNGSTVYITLYSLVGTSWNSNSYTYTAVNPAAGGGATMTTPIQGSTLAGSTVTFTWAKGTATPQAYWLYAGSSAGASNYYNSGSISSRTTSKAATGLPTNGSTVYVTLFTEIAGTYVPVPYTYTAAGGPNASATLSSPTAGSPLCSNSATFSWNAPASGTPLAYWVDVGTAPGGNTIYQSGSMPTSPTSITVNGLPVGGSTIYVTLYTEFSNSPVAWQNNMYNFVAASLDVVNSPTNGSVLSSPEQTFGWTNNNPSCTMTYELDISAIAPGGNDVWQSGDMLPGFSATNPTTNPMPDNSNIYTTLYTLNNGTLLGHTENAYTTNNAFGPVQVNGGKQHGAKH